MMAPQMPPNQGNSNNQPPYNSPYFSPDVRSASPSLAYAAPPLAQAVPVTTVTPSVTTTATYLPSAAIFTPITSIVSTTTVFPQAQITPESSHHHDSGGGGNQFPQQQQQQQGVGGTVGGLSGGVLAAAGVIATLIVVLMLVACCCVVFRKRRRRSSSADTIMRPMVKTPGPMPVPARAHIRTAEPATAASLTSPSTTSTPSTNTQHVLLTTTMDQSYYTGIDTSDAISLAERQPGPATAISDEPPPPYRPRSVPPVSRGNSLRVNDGLAGYQPGQNMRSPFDDPVDEDGLSDLGNDCGGREIDRLSAVSDLSYQEEATAVRSAI
jgi:hypothetical protein